MAYVSFLLFARFMAIIDVAWTAPYPRRASMPCSADVQISHDDCAPEMCRRQSALSIPHEHLWLARVLPCLVFLYITIVVLALLVIARACYGAASSHREEDESPSSRSPLMGRSRASSTTLYSSSPHQLSVAYPTPSHQQSFQASGTGINSFAPSFVDSPKRQGTLQSLDGPNFEQGSDNRRTSAISQPTDLEVVIHSRSTTVDDQTSTTFYHSTKLRYETQPPENYIPTESGRAQSALRTQLEAGRRAETAPNFIIRSASRQLTLLKSLIRRASMQPIQRADVRILGVGLGWDHDEDMALPGPAHDIQWLKTLFENHQYVRFSYLLHNDATYGGIRQRLEETYESATVDTYLIVYYTGHGTENNSLRLYDPSSEPINEVVMNKWIVELREKTGKHIPVYVVFDFCRASPVEPETNLNRDIYIIWACSPLQDALDLDWGSEGEFERDLPRSCFLMALILAVHDTSTNPLFPSWRNFATRLKELVNVVRGGEYWQSKDRLPWLRCRCRACLGGDICANARNSEERHLFQVVSLSTLEENPDFATVARFVASHFPLRIQRVVRHVSNNHWVMFFNPVRITANRGSLQSRQLEFLRSNISVSTQITVRHMTVPIGLSHV